MAALEGKTSKKRSATDANIKTEANKNKAQKSAKTGKPNGASKFQKKGSANGDKPAVDFKLQRKMNRPHYEVVKRAKEIWNIIRERDVEKTKRTQLVEELFHLVSGKIYDVAAKHDASRVIQSLLKFGTPAQRTSVIQELQPQLLELAKLQYGCFLVTKMLKYGSKEDRALIVREMTGNVVKLATHNVAANMLESAHEYLQPRQLSGLKLEFYGKEFAYFKSEMEDKKKTLADIIDHSPSKKEEILTHVADLLNRMVDKQLLGLAFVQALMLEYLTVASTERINAMVPNIRDAAVALLATRAGAKVVVICLSVGTPKDRKRIIKTLKDKVFEACNHISGYLVLLRILDVVDDTVLVQKSILSELHSHWLDVALHQNGSKVLLQLLSPLNSKYFGPEEIQLLQPPMVDDNGEQVVNYKKDPQVRRNELWKGLKSTIETMCSENAAALLRSKSGGHVLFEVVKQADNEDLTAAVFDAVMNEEAQDGVEPLFADSLAHKQLQRLIGIESFGKALLEALTKPAINTWAKTNRGSFVLLAFVKEQVAGASAALKKALDVKKLSATEKALAGTKLLLEKLELA
ncbi:unnamed protein product [Aphanomyces euteiches]|uniref:PUM-HD domain-containing protein n=1 Tax=Aphanomyces euteiches TaxID=100861 RepID=A0A6G0XRX1_9STRA|nr:hypothetical protein Ae201684_001990 [Aphanomyces euteiches]KAH9086802.1 hypothetical protein Ae201684P_000221 [Aphanomyces euteiches]KAH9156069.1 hypothetical protein AeRB84_002002 [Aphanomyces euteiches]